MAEQPDPPLSKDHLATFLAHPIRSRLLYLLAVAGPATIKDLGELMDTPERTVRDHLRPMQDQGSIVRVDERQRGGMRANVYEVHPELFIADQYLAGHLPDGSYRRLRIETARRLLEGVRGSIGSGLLTSRSDHAFSWRSGRIDEQGWQQLSALHHA